MFRDFQQEREGYIEGIVNEQCEGVRERGGGVVRELRQNFVKYSGFYFKSKGKVINCLKQGIDMIIFVFLIDYFVYRMKNGLEEGKIGKDLVRLVKRLRIVILCES